MKNYDHFLKILILPLFLVINFPNFPTLNKSPLIFSPIPEDRVIIMNNVNTEAKTGNKEAPKSEGNILTGEASARSSVITITNQDQEIVTKIETAPSATLTPSPQTSTAPTLQNSNQDHQPEENSGVKSLTILIKLITLSIFRR